MTEVETLQRQLQREQRNLDQREYELSEAQARVHSLVAQRNNLRQSVKEIQERLDAAERLVALEEENATLRRQVAECNNVHKSSF